MSLSTARSLARNWWKSSEGSRSRSRGYAICDSCSGRISSGEGCLAAPTNAFDSTPDLVCESCYTRRSRTPFDAAEAAAQKAIAGALLAQMQGGGQQNSPRRNPVMIGGIAVGVLVVVAIVMAMFSGSDDSDPGTPPSQVVDSAPSRPMESPEDRVRSAILAGRAAIASAENVHPAAAQFGHWRVLEMHDVNVTDFDLAGTSNDVGVVADDAGQIHFVTLSTGKTEGTLVLDESQNSPGGNPVWVSTSKDGNRIVAVRGSVLTLWDLPSGRQIKQISIPEPLGVQFEEIDDLSSWQVVTGLSPDGQTVGVRYQPLPRERHVAKSEPNLFTSQTVHADPAETPVHIWNLETDTHARRLQRGSIDEIVFPADRKSVHVTSWKTGLLASADAVSEATGEMRPATGSGSINSHPGGPGASAFGGDPLAGTPGMGIGGAQTHLAHSTWLASGKLSPARKTETRILVDNHRLIRLSETDGTIALFDSRSSREVVSLPFPESFQGRLPACRLSAGRDRLLMHDISDSLHVWSIPGPQVKANQIISSSLPDTTPTSDPVPTLSRRAVIEIPDRADGAENQIAYDANGNRLLINQRGIDFAGITSELKSLSGTVVIDLAAAARQTLFSRPNAGLEPGPGAAISFGSRPVNLDEGVAQKGSALQTESVPARLRAAATGNFIQLSRLSSRNGEVPEPLRVAVSLATGEVNSLPEIDTGMTVSRISLSSDGHLLLAEGTGPSESRFRAWNLYPLSDDSHPVATVLAVPISIPSGVSLQLPAISRDGRKLATVRGGEIETLHLGSLIQQDSTETASRVRVRGKQIIDLKWLSDDHLAVLSREVPTHWIEVFQASTGLCVGRSTSRSAKSIAVAANGSWLFALSPTRVEVFGTTGTGRETANDESRAGYPGNFAALYELHRKTEHSNLATSAFLLDDDLLLKHLHWENALTRAVPGARWQIALVVDVDAALLKTRQRDVEDVFEFGYGFGEAESEVIPAWVTVFETYANRIHERVADAIVKREMQAGLRRLIPVRQEFASGSPIDEDDKIPLGGGEIEQLLGGDSVKQDAPEPVQFQSRPEIVEAKTEVAALSAAQNADVDFLVTIRLEKRGSRTPRVELKIHDVLTGRVLFQPRLAVGKDQKAWDRAIENLILLTSEAVTKGLPAPPGIKTKVDQLAESVRVFFPETGTVHRPAAALTSFRFSALSREPIVAIRNQLPTELQSSLNASLSPVEKLSLLVGAVTSTRRTR